MKFLNGHYIRKWRKARKLSACELGRALGYRGRETVAHIESGNLEITERFAARFEKFKHQTQAREYRERRIQSKYPLPPRIKILAKPRKCKICHEWFIFAHPDQRVCTDRKCKRAYARLHPGS